MNKIEAARAAYYEGDRLPPECDAMCRYRSCLNKYENKGTYSVGRGYTSYHGADVFQPVCGTRQNHGCGTSDFKVRGYVHPDMKEVETRIDSLSPTGSRYKVADVRDLIRLSQSLVAYIKDVHALLDTLAGKVINDEKCS